MKKEITIIMPAKNEEQCISDAVQCVQKTLKELDLNGYIIVVNDGSTDSTMEIVKLLMNEFKNIDLINNSKSLGIGGAFLKGVSKAKTPYVVLLPGDNENDPISILSQLQYIDDRDFLIPYVTNQNVRSFFRASLSKVFTVIINLSFGKKIKYYNGTCIYKADHLRKLVIQSNGFFFNVEIIIKLLKDGYKYKEVPVTLTNKDPSQSHALKLNSFKAVIIDYIKLLNWFYIGSGKYEK